MKIVMYGAEICPDCVNAKEVMQKDSDIELDYRSITESTTTLKEFLAYRDHEELFQSVKENGKIGIPFFILEDGTKTLEITDFMSIDNLDNEKSVNFCSIDGRGNC
jgi:glutaredoxin-related protein